MHTSHSAIFWLKLLVFGVVGLFVLVMALLFLAIFLASLFERQRVCDYISPNGKPMPPESPYLKVMNETARLMGFQPGGVFAHSRNGAMYRLSLTLWLSPDKNSLL